MIYVRKRDCCFLVRLTEEEMAKLMKQVQKTGLSRENYIRALIENSPIRERPPKEFFMLLEKKSIRNTKKNLRRLKQIIHMMSWKCPAHVQYGQRYFLCMLLR